MRYVLVGCGLNCHDFLDNCVFVLQEKVSRGFFFFVEVEVWDSYFNKRGECGSGGLTHEDLLGAIDTNQRRKIF